MASMRIRQIMSGEATGWGADMTRMLLGGAAGWYSRIIRVRNRNYDAGKGVFRLEAPVVSVGNITAGGTGKTPMVIWLAKALRAMGRRPAILSRGYGDQQGWNDENRLLKTLLPDVPVVIDSDRVAGGQRAIAEAGADLLILDDGFQHRRLGRDLDMVLIDATCPFGYGYVLPRGLLREPVENLRRAGLIVITRSDMIDADELEKLEEKIAEVAGQAVPILHAVHQPVDLVGEAGEKALGELAGKKVLAFCTIGNAGAFAQQIRGLGATVMSVSFADHGGYDEMKLEQLKSRAEAFQADWCVTTEKDWMKLREMESARQWRELYRMRITLEITRGYDILADKLRSL